MIMYIGVRYLSLKGVFKIAMIDLKKIFSRLLSELPQTHDFQDVLALYEKGAFDEAYRVFCEVIDNEPRLSKVGDVYIMWADLELLANNNARKALELLDRAQEMDCSQIAYYYLKRAEALWITGERQMALQCYEKSVAADSCLFYLSGYARALSCNNDKRAMRVWQQVLDRDPKSFLAHAYIGWEAAKSGAKDKGLLMSKKAEELASSVVDVFELGRLYHESEEFQSAINKYLEAKKLGYKDQGLLYAAIADCYLSLGIESQACKYAELAMSYKPENYYVKDVWQKCQSCDGAC